MHGSPQIKKPDSGGDSGNHFCLYRLLCSQEKHDENTTQKFNGEILKKKTTCSFPHCEIFSYVKTDHIYGGLWLSPAVENYYIIILYYIIKKGFFSVSETFVSTWPVWNTLQTDTRLIVEKNLFQRQK